MTIKLRAHHALCLLSFEGKGYSSHFVKNMSEVQKNLDEIQFIESCDCICQACYHRNGSRCAYTKVKGYDQKVLKEMTFKKDKTYQWKEIKPLLEKLDLSNICSDCQWFSICKKRRLNTNL